MCSGWRTGREGARKYYLDCCFRLEQTKRLTREVGRRRSGALVVSAIAVKKQQVKVEIFERGRWGKCWAILQLVKRVLLYLSGAFSGVSLEAPGVKLD
jgi:hypothetical protein